MYRSLPFRSKKILKLVLALGAIFFLSGCRADIDVLVEVEPDGSGEVTVSALLDKETADGLFDLTSGVPINDLDTAGWQVLPPSAKSAGDQLISASKPFGTPEEFAQIMGEVSGPDGLLRGFELTRNKSFGRVDYVLEGAIDTTRGFDAFGDQSLSESLDSSLADIAQTYDAVPEDVAVKVLADLPGKAETDVASGALETPEGVIYWNTSLASASQTSVNVSSATRSPMAQVFRGLAIVLVVMAGLLAFSHLLRIRNQRKENATKSIVKQRPVDARGQKMPAPPRGQTNEMLVPELSGQDVESQTGIRVVCLDGMGVLYKEPDNIANILVPFAHEHGSVLTDSEITAHARSLTLGRLSPNDFWSAVGVEGNLEEIEKAYLSRLQLNPGVVRYVTGLRERGIRVACMINDCVQWATKLRTQHSLDTLVDVWVVSGSVGVRKPYLAMFEVLRRLSEVPPEQIMVIDDELYVLDVATDLDFQTSWYAPEGTVEEAKEHTLIRSLG